MTVFSISDDRLRDLAQDALNVARSIGASDASCEVSETTGLSVTVRKRKVETIEHTRDKGLGVTVYLGQRRGHASTSDFSTGAVRQAVEAAHNIARFTAEDDAAGLPDEDTLERNPRDVDLFPSLAARRRRGDPPGATLRVGGLCSEPEDRELGGRQRPHVVGSFRARQYP